LKALGRAGDGLTQGVGGRRVARNLSEDLKNEAI